MRPRRGPCLPRALELQAAPSLHNGTFNNQSGLEQKKTCAKGDLRKQPGLSMGYSPLGDLHVVRPGSIARRESQQGHGKEAPPGSVGILMGRLHP